MPTPKLDPRPARNDLTSRECAKILSGLIGTLYDQTTPEALRDAVRWCAETDAMWQQFEDLKALIPARR
jgi:hypothetical protein